LQRGVINFVVAEAKDAGLSVMYCRKEEQQSLLVALMNKNLDTLCRFSCVTVQAEHASAFIGNILVLLIFSCFLSALRSGLEVRGCRKLKPVLVITGGWRWDALYSNASYMLVKHTS